MKKIVYIDQFEKEKLYTNKLALYLKSSGYELVLPDNIENAHALTQAQDKPDLLLAHQSYFDQYHALTPQGIKQIILTDDPAFESQFNFTENKIEDVIVRPKDVELIKLAVDEVLTERDPGDEQRERYYGVQIDDIISNSRHSFSLFLKINNKYVCFAKSGQDFSTQKFKLLTDKGMKTIYLNSKDYAIYTDLLFTQKDQTARRPLQQALRQKASSFFRNRLSTNSIFNAINKENAQRALAQFENFSQVAMENKVLGKAISQMIEETPGLAEKNSLMATISSCVADMWKWNSPKIQSRIVIGSLVCDIGLKDHPELIAKKKIELSKEETRLYEEHPLRSYKMLSQVEDMPEEILQISIQHHENSVGSGYPQKITRNQIHSFAKLVHGVNEFVETIFGPKGLLSPLEALTQMFTMQRKIVSEQVLKTLYKIFNLALPKELEGVLLPDKSGMLV